MLESTVLAQYQFVRRNRDGSFVLFETLDDLNVGGDCVSNLLDSKPQSWEEWNQAIPQWAHLKADNVLYLEPERSSSSDDDDYYDDDDDYYNDRFNAEVDKYPGGFEDAKDDPNFWSRLGM